MSRAIDPKKLGLSPRTVIRKTGNNNFILIKNRKSRIIISDGKRILKQVEKIRESFPGAEVSVKTSDPVCGKTRLFLKSKGIDISNL